MFDVSNANKLVRGRRYCLVPTKDARDKYPAGVCDKLLLDGVRYVRHENLRGELAGGEPTREWETFSTSFYNILTRIRVPTKAIVKVEKNRVVVDGELVTKVVLGEDNLADIKKLMIIFLLRQFAVGLEK